MSRHCSGSCRLIPLFMFALSCIASAVLLFWPLATKAQGQPSTAPRPVTSVFFDVGGTLGEVSENPGDKELSLHLYSDTRELLKTLKLLGLRLGVISNVPADMTASSLAKILKDAGIYEFFEPELVVASSDVKASKPAPQIYKAAASRAKIPIGSCLYIGEDLAEVIGAQAAGMRSQLKPRPQR